MKLNLTTLLLLGILGLVAYKLLQPGGLLTAGAGGGSPNSNPAGSKPGAGEASPDLFAQITGTVASIFSTISSVAKSQPQSN